jgi:hypothetical protein
MSWSSDYLEKAVEKSPETPVKTTVVNIHKKQPFDVYIGRPGKWGNPFLIGVDGPREEILRKYERWFSSQPDLVEEARAKLKGKRLGCFCAPLPCHGDIIARIIDEKVKDHE